MIVEPCAVSHVPKGFSLDAANGLVCIHYEEGTKFLPAAYHGEDGGLEEIDIGDAPGLMKYFMQELDVSRLNEIHKHLCFAGFEGPGEALHYHLSMGRIIVVTEKTDIHLVWHESRIILKPLPEFLICYEIWNNYLCKDRELYANATGLLLSYLWLVCSKSDFAIAIEKALLPRDLSWEKWVEFSKAVLKTIDHHNFKNVNSRYRYGELKLNRLNWIYCLCSWKRSFTDVILGYSYLFHPYSTYFQRNTAWLAGATIYIVVVLTAMQVGLSTDRLKDNDLFQAASYGFTVFSIMAPLIILASICAFILFTNILTFYMYMRNKEQRKKQEANDPALKPYIH